MYSSHFALLCLMTEGESRKIIKTKECYSGLGLHLSCLYHVECWWFSPSNIHPPFSANSVFLFLQLPCISFVPTTKMLPSMETGRHTIQARTVRLSFSNRNFESLQWEVAGTYHPSDGFSEETGPFILQDYMLGMILLPILLLSPLRILGSVYHLLPLLTHLIYVII